MAICSVMGDLAAVLQMLEGLAPKLRAAGVLSVKVDGFELELAPAEPVESEPNAAAPVDQDDDDSDPLNDAATYGGRVPGYPALRRRKQETDR